MFRSLLLTLEKLKSNVRVFELMTLTSETENIVFSEKGKDISLQGNNMIKARMMTSRDGTITWLRNKC